MRAGAGVLSIVLMSSLSQAAVLKFSCDFESEISVKAEGNEAIEKHQVIILATLSMNESELKAAIDPTNKGKNAVMAQGSLEYQGVPVQKSIDGVIVETEVDYKFPLAAVFDPSNSISSVRLNAEGLIKGVQLVGTSGKKLVLGITDENESASVLIERPNIPALRNITPDVKCQADRVEEKPNQATIIVRGVTNTLKRIF